MPDTCLNQNTTSHETPTASGLSVQYQDYSNLLKTAGLAFVKVGYYYLVGDIRKTQGWILHLSVIQSQIPDLLRKVIPYLKGKQISFKIPIDSAISEGLLDGSLTTFQIGKIVTIYPEDDRSAAEIASDLIEVTQGYKGPLIPTDFCLGSIVYTRYGSFNPIVKSNRNGDEERYIYDKSGNLIQDIPSIPFSLPDQIQWPFTIKYKSSLPHKRYLDHIYKPLSVLKLDPRGNVFKGLYLKGFLNIKKCVIKQGLKNMTSDVAGRDIQDRLNWQYQLYKELCHTIPMPAIYDIFEEQGATYLVMEYIAGMSLEEKHFKLNPLQCAWLGLDPVVSNRLIQHILEIIKIIALMHQKGFVHRDITPLNFLITESDQLYVIDLELAYSFRQSTPFPPFTLGTEGFMSPEQRKVADPTIKEDIYGIGATILYLLVGLTPSRFNTTNQQFLISNLSFFLGDPIIASLIAMSLRPEPDKRPELSEISCGLANYQKAIRDRSLLKYHLKSEHLNTDRLKEVITCAVSGLNAAPITIKDGIWSSRRINAQTLGDPRNREYHINTGLFQGLSGVLYTIARLQKANIDVSPCIAMYRNSANYLRYNYLSQSPNPPPGLYSGAAGVALAFAEGVSSGLIEHEISLWESISAILGLPHQNNLSIANGIAGQGISMFRCTQLLKGINFSLQLEGILETLLSKRLTIEGWHCDEIGQKDYNSLNYLEFGHSQTGTLWFLLDFLKYKSNTQIQIHAEEAIATIVNDKKTMSAFINLVCTRTSYELGDGGKGFILLLIKAYETLGNTKYKQIAKSALAKYPLKLVSTNFTQQSGLSGLGEIFLEAWRVFGEDEWKYRADWIAELFIHTQYRSGDSSGAWIMEETRPPTADLMIGNCGIIHFLCRCLTPLNVGYRVLN